MTHIDDNIDDDGMAKLEVGRGVEGLVGEDIDVHHAKPITYYILSFLSLKCQMSFKLALEMKI